MLTISHTPEPYSSTTLTLSADEQYPQHGRDPISSILITPATLPHAGRAGDPVFFQEIHVSGKTNKCGTFGDTAELPAHLQGLVSQVMADYIRTGPVPAVPPLSKQAERMRSGSAAARLGRRLGKGQWSR